MQKLRLKTKPEEYTEALAICEISEDEKGNKIYTPEDFLIVYELTKEEKKTLHDNDGREDIAYITSEGNVYVASDIKYETKTLDTIAKKETKAIFEQLISQKNLDKYSDTEKQKITDTLNIYLSEQ